MRRRSGAQVICRMGPGSAAHRYALRCARDTRQEFSHLLGETGAKRMRRIDPEDLELLGEERQLLERERKRAVVGMALDVGIELRGEEIALDHVALELGHVDA